MMKKLSLLIVVLLSVLVSMPASAKELYFPATKSLYVGKADNKKTVNNYYSTIFDRKNWSNDQVYNRYKNSFDKAKSEGNIFILQNITNSGEYSIKAFWSENKPDQKWLLQNESLNSDRVFKFSWQGDNFRRTYAVDFLNGTVSPYGSPYPDNQGRDVSLWQTATGTNNYLYLSNADVTLHESMAGFSFSGFHKGTDPNMLSLDEYTNIFDCTSDDFKDKLGCVFETELNDITFGLHKLLVEPLKTLLVIQNQGCSPVDIKLLNSKIVIPCISTVVPDYVLRPMQVIWIGLITWWIVINLLGKIRSVHNPHDDRIEVIKL